MSAVFRDAALDAAFGRDGVAVRPLLAAAEVAAARALFDRHLEQHDTPFSATIQSLDLDYRRQAHDGLCALFTSHVDRLLDGYRIFMAGFLAKQPGPDGAMPMHQDLSLVARGPRPALSIWCPLVDVDEENAAVEVVAGSQVLNEHPRAAGTPFAGAPHEERIRAEFLRSVPMAAGEALFLHHGVFHSSPPHRGSAVRPVVAVVLAPIESPLVYYFRRPDVEPPMLEEYDVDDAFYLSHAFGSRPDDVARTRELPEQIEPCSLSRLLAALAPFAAPHWSPRA